MSLIDFQEFAKQISNLKQLLDSQKREFLNVFIVIDGKRYEPYSIELKDDGSGCDNLDVILNVHIVQ